MLFLKVRAPKSIQTPVVVTKASNTFKFVSLYPPQTYKKILPRQTLTNFVSRLSSALPQGRFRGKIFRLFEPTRFQNKPALFEHVRARQKPELTCFVRVSRIFAWFTGLLVDNLCDESAKSHLMFDRLLLLHDSYRINF
jgi:hypothetical protein